MSNKIIHGMFIKKLILIFSFLSSIIFVCAHNIHSKTKINYILHVDTSDLSRYSVEMHIYNAPKSFHVAMATHKEYDDRYWRFIENFKVDDKNKFVREDSALWLISVSGKDVVIKYDIHLPSQTEDQRPVWKPFLTATGGMVGDIHSFMYLVEMAQMPVSVTFQLPPNWQISTGLESTNNPKIFTASNAITLLDCPVMVGKFEKWDFTISNIPHSIAYWNSPNATSFNKMILVNTIKKIVQQSIGLFGIAPYKHYTFLLQDGAYAALEHANSVTLGIPSNTFYRDTIDTYQEIAHEYFHAWNLVSLRPAEYSELNYGLQEKSKELWWCEGLTMFYADLLLRRARLSVYNSTRTDHLQQLIERYFSNPGNAKISPERSSLETNEQPGGLGDYDISVHLQGEILGALLDLMIRDATNNKRSIDDVMRKMFFKFPEKKGFYSSDVERTAKDICGCDAHSFFEKYIYSANEIDFNHYLKLMGKEVIINWTKANENKKLLPDLRIFSWIKRGETSVRVGIENAECCWAKAGLHTGDKILKINSKPITSTKDFFSEIRNVKIGDEVKMEVEQNQIVKQITINVIGYNIPTARITSLSNISPKQKLIFEKWNNQ